MPSFEVLEAGEDPQTAAETQLVPGVNLVTGMSDFERDFGSATSLESDLLTLAAAVFAADRATARGDRERVGRRIELTVPVTNAARLTPLEGQLETLLRQLSNDSWRISLPQRPGDPEEQRDWPADQGSTLLFSGGLDSLAAAVSIGEEVPLPYLVSHHTRNAKTSAAQRGLVEDLRKLGRAHGHSQFYVSAKSDLPSGFDHQAEGSQRTRSLMFMVLGALVGRRTGHRDILVLAENGQLAIHLPLSSARVGSFSTHTAFPDVLVRMEEILAAALDPGLTIRNPFVHKTKAEVIKTVLDFSPDLVSKTESCWKNARLPAGATHCGECIPCYVRRIAIEANGVPDPTAYASDPWTALPAPDVREDDTGRRNLVELAEFIVQFGSLSNVEIMDAWPELYSPNIDEQQVIEMYRRFSSEARMVLSTYPDVSRLLE